jgi:zinc protease
MKRIFILLGFLMAITTAQAAKADDKIYNAQSITLPNAMQVVVVENPRTPAVTHMVWYRIGGGDEVLGESGLAHYLEHLMFKGTDLVAPGDFSKKVKSWGGNDNAFTSWDFTAYFQTVPKDKLKSVMIMEADRMRNLNFDDADALTERDVVIEERKQRTDSNPMAQLDEAMRAALFVNHPYARPIIGWDHELQQLTPAAAREFYHKYYAPKNAILVISGDVVAKDVFQEAALIYGKIENDGALSRPQWPSVPFMYGTKMVEHKHESIRQPIYRKTYRVPGMGQDYNAALACGIAENIIGGNTGKLYQSLVVDKKLVSSISFRYGGVSVSDSTLSIGATPKDDVTFDQIAVGIQDVFNNIIENGITDEDVQKAVSQLQDESVYERDSLTGPAMMIGYQLVSGLELDQIENWANDIESVTADDVRAVVQNYLVPSADKYHAVTGYLMPQDTE